ncbi:MAG: DNA polymerase III subunit delta' [Candidatus Saganbacteria bacterium]|nr:DNA polymerase III subunit delta' [Candidatus Saganbacteria bacterium]
MSFKDIPNQERVKRILAGATGNDRVPNAYLFAGPKGSSKLKTALALAGALNCEKGGVDSCGSCSTCEKIKGGIHPDVINFVPKGASIKIDEVRELRSFVRYGPSSGKWLVAIVHDADKFTIEAANSFLKVLEEPPPHVLFILISAKEKAILSTIVSRCQKIVFTEVEGQKNTDIGEGEILSLCKEFDSIKGKSIVDLLRMSFELQEKKDRVQDLLDQVLYKYAEDFRSGRSVKEAIKIILDTQSKIRDNANLRLALDLMCLKLKEAFNG